MLILFSIKSQFGFSLHIVLCPIFENPSWWWEKINFGNFNSILWGTKMYLWKTLHARLHSIFLHFPDIHSSIEKWYIYFLPGRWYIKRVKRKSIRISICTFFSFLWCEKLYQFSSLFSTFDNLIYYWSIIFTLHRV